MSEKKELSEADKIWSEISKLRIDVFAIPNQTVSNHVTKLDIDGPELFVKLKSTAALPALEYTLGKKYTLETAEGYVIIRRSNEERDMKVKKALEALTK